MESSYRLLHRVKYRDLLGDAERERLANSLRGPRRSSVGPWALSLIGVAAAVLVVLLRVV